MDGKLLSKPLITTSVCILSYLKAFWKWTIISDPHNAFYICKTLGVEPSQTIMVGDTPADTLMGQEVSVYVLSFLMKAMLVE
jgi:phosphoglycolate phosphatase-like HAD superfamily hydrolase